jgi:hypothetical protein
MKQSCREEGAMQKNKIPEIYRAVPLGLYKTLGNNVPRMKFSTFFCRGR